MFLAPFTPSDAAKTQHVEDLSSNVMFHSTAVVN